MSTALPRGYDAAAVVIPAHNERAELRACLRAVLTAALCAPIPVTVVVVLDGCDDGSDELAGEYGPDVHFVSVDVHNAATARAVGVGYARSVLGADARTWFATIDAGSQVDPRWLADQLRSGADLVERFEAAGHHIHRDTDLSVITSKRIPARAPYGFADYLTQLGRTAAGDCA